MSDKNINNLEMQFNNDNDSYYIEKLNYLIHGSDNESLIIKNKNDQFMRQNVKSKGCLERFCELFRINKKEDNDENFQFVGLVNVGNNCYLNAGLQILSRCYPLIIELLKCNYEKNELIKLFVETTTALIFKKDKFYNPLLNLLNAFVK